MSDRDGRSWNDDDRPSWRELDKRRDRSSHRPNEKPAFAGGKKQQAYARTLALHNAGQLFVPKKDAAQLQAEADLAAAKGTPGFVEAAKAFIATYGITKDWRVHVLLAAVPDSEVAVPAIEALAARAGSLDASELRNIVAALKTVAMTGKTRARVAAKKALEILENLE
jgi:hypothetical protein